MRSVGVNKNVTTTKGLAELNRHNRVELKEVRNGAGFDGHGLCEEDESRINDLNSARHIGSIQAYDALQRPNHVAQGPLVQWERFLPIRSIKVLLVENDDSTRHVVSALLRNCSYEVTAVANGLEAWNVLIDLNKQIDLVLTEVVMPYLSGIGLLSKIMNDVTRKNTPVIMMSSDDSMGIVFNCLSKGAVDFLVKPIRKNELKNLWQHVWRKCHSQSSGSGSGSGSESGIRDNRSAKSRRTQESDDDSDNSDEDDDDVSIELNAKGGSDYGSGTQSSWPKRAVEVDSSQAKSFWDNLPNSHDINDGQRARPETSKSHWRSTIANRVDLTVDDKLEIIEMGKDLEIGVPKSSSCEVDNKGMDNANSKNAGNNLDISMQLGRQNDVPITEPLGPTKISNVHMESLKANHLLKKINIEDESIYYPKESPALELTLKRPRDAEDADVSAQERNVLRQSGVSAFSRYNTSSNINQAPTGNVGSCSPFDISSEAAKPDNLQSNSNGTPNQRSNGSDDMGSTTNNAFATKPDDKPLPNKSTVVVHHNQTSTLEPVIPSANDGGDAVKSATGVQQQVQVRHHHHHYHHHHHHVHKQKMMDHDDGSFKNMVSNILTGSTEGNAANYGSASGSNNKSNGENGKIESDNDVAKKDHDVTIKDNVVAKQDNDVTNKRDGGDGSGSGSGVDQERLTQRQAALNKFRQKRKERCFQKKVRYQSRKKLAEQRPRVRGQFVRHGANGVNNEYADS